MILGLLQMELVNIYIYWIIEIITNANTWHIACGFQPYAEVCGS